MVFQKLKSNYTGRIILSSLSILFAFSQSVQAGTLAGSKHDFSNLGWGSKEICVACHTPHNADSGQSAQLWNHAVSSASYIMYDSPSLDQTTAATDRQPDGTSRLCLSCHDGTVGLDSFGGVTGTTTYITGSANLSTDLSDDHPISIDFNADIATKDGSLHNPDTTTVTIGSGDKFKTGTISEVMLSGGTVQCSSCHDVHNSFTAGDPLLKISSVGSQLCLTCHDK